MLAVVKVVGSSMALVGIGVVVYVARTEAGDCVMKPLIRRSDGAVVAGRAQAPRTATMRVDYYHTGNEKEEHFSLDRVLVEPLPWPGHPSKPIDTTNRGKYLFEVVDAAGKLSVLARFQLDLRRVGNDRRSQGDESHVLGIAAIPCARRAGARSS